MVARPCPRFGSTFSTMIRLNTSAQVSSGAVRMPLAAAWADRPPNRSVPPRCAVGPDRFGREGVQMRLVAGRDLQGRGLHLDDVLALEPVARRPQDAVARGQERRAVRPPIRRPPRTLSRL